MATKHDFTFTNHCSVWTITAVSAAAKEFAEANFDVPCWAGTPENFNTDGVLPFA